MADGHVVVVGAGLAGLTAALHLRGAGREVTVVEREAFPGGRAGRLDLPDGHGGHFRLDTGPTVLTMPDLLEEPLRAVGEKLGDRLDLVRLDPAYHARFADGSSIDVHTDGDAMEQEIREKVSVRDAEGYRRLRHWLTELYGVQMATFIDANFDSPLDVVSRDLVKLGLLGGFGRLGPRVGRFIHDERLRRIFSFQALYAGVPPARALAAYAVIAYMDTIAGVYFPKGGVRALPQAYADAAAAAGVEFRYGAEVTALEQQGGRVTAVETTGGTIAADAVVLTPDLPAVHELVGRRPRRAVPLRWSPSAFVVHLGLDRPQPDLGHHTISFGDAWASTFDEIITEGRLMRDPSLLVTRPTTTDPSLAPAGGDYVSVLAPCPNLASAPDLDWDRIAPRYRDELFGVLAGRGIDLDGHVVAEHRISPADWARMGMAAGTPFSAAHTFAQTGPFRSGNRLRGLDNAFLAGCGTTPGVGVPTVVVSGKLAAARIAGMRS
ncbi:phytoene desaturase family protein [Actinomycetospora sp. NBRC 106378]|uniref:phytoene desaturase family protein n=1 Tax=Actinomycetospora sp. NBRC 106378 TaxID=3032208 RepID=UPI0024A45898|nr:phytoene desaturase family protein [Actinomycetospora sp. NBRC 106378]GLZ53344.1 phytoene dehydrogenase [Actinomycetospora sp. NBRC 106378]